MTLSTSNPVVGQGVKASDLLQVFHHVNSTPGLVVFAANGSWQVPDGVHKFRVTLYGGGGSGMLTTDPATRAGEDGVRARTYFTGIAIGTSYIITVGAGQPYTGGTGQGGSTSFGASFVAPGGRDAITMSTYTPSQTATFPGGLPQLYVPKEYLFPFADTFRGYGDGGWLTDHPDDIQRDGTDGLVIIEW